MTTLLNDTRTEFITELLCRVRREFGMEFSCLMRLKDATTLQVECHDGLINGHHITPGAEFSWEGSICKRVTVDGYGQVLDAAHDARTSDLESVQELGVKSYVGIPILLEDGSQYGVLCCISSATTQLSVRDGASLMRFVAAIIAQQLQNDILGGEDDMRTLWKPSRKCTLAITAATALSWLLAVVRHSEWTIALGQGLTVLFVMAVAFGVYARSRDRLSSTDARCALVMRQYNELQRKLEDESAVRAQSIVLDTIGQRLGEDRQRIAADLHDTVIQRLYALGLMLEMKQLDSTTADQILDGLNSAVHELRRAIYHLTAPTDSSTVYKALNDIVLDARLCSSADVNVQLSASLKRVPAQIAGHAVAVLREGISNAIRHGRPQNIQVCVEYDDRVFTIKVMDDGCGFVDTDLASNGRTNLRERAKLLGGTCEWQTSGAGTSLEWSVPAAN